MIQYYFSAVDHLNVDDHCNAFQSHLEHQEILIEEHAIIRYNDLEKLAIPYEVSVILIVSFKEQLQLGLRLSDVMVHRQKMCLPYEDISILNILEKMFQQLERRPKNRLAVITPQKLYLQRNTNKDYSYSLVDYIPEWYKQADIEHIMESQFDWENLQYYHPSLLENLQHHSPVPDRPELYSLLVLCLDLMTLGAFSIEFREDIASQNTLKLAIRPYIAEFIAEFCCKNDAKLYSQYPIIFTLVKVFINQNMDQKTFDTIRQTILNHVTEHSELRIESEASTKELITQREQELEYIIACSRQEKGVISIKWTPSTFKDNLISFCNKLYAYVKIRHHSRAHLVAQQTETLIFNYLNSIGMIIIPNDRDPLLQMCDQLTRKTYNLLVNSFDQLIEFKIQQCQLFLISLDYGETNDIAQSTYRALKVLAIAQQTYSKQPSINIGKRMEQIELIRDVNSLVQATKLANIGNLIRLDTFTDVQWLPYLSFMITYSIDCCDSNQYIQTCRLVYDHIFEMERKLLQSPKENLFAQRQLKIQLRHIRQIRKILDVSRAIQQCLMFSTRTVTQRMVISRCNDLVEEYSSVIMRELLSYFMHLGDGPRYYEMLESVEQCIQSKVRALLNSSLPFRLKSGIYPLFLYEAYNFTKFMHYTADFISSCTTLLPIFSQFQQSVCPFQRYLICHYGQITGIDQQQALQISALLKIKVEDPSCKLLLLIRSLLLKPQEKGIDYLQARFKDLIAQSSPSGIIPVQAIIHQIIGRAAQSSGDTESSSMYHQNSIRVLNQMKDLLDKKDDKLNIRQRQRAIKTLSIMIAQELYFVIVKDHCKRSHIKNMTQLLNQVFVHREFLRDFLVLTHLYCKFMKDYPKCTKNYKFVEHLLEQANQLKHHSVPKKLDLQISWLESLVDEYMQLPDRRVKLKAVQDEYTFLINKLLGSIQNSLRKSPHSKQQEMIAFEEAKMKIVETINNHTAQVNQDNYAIDLWMIDDEKDKQVSSEEDDSDTRMN